MSRLSRSLELELASMASNRLGLERLEAGSYVYTTILL
jgi:hypothetical protein